jgi:hypothetical protein
MSEAQTITVQELLIATIRKRWGIYFGKKALLKELMHNTAKELASVKKASQTYRDALQQLIEGKGDREAVKKASEALERARATYREKAAPYRAKLAPVNQVLSGLDNATIPKLIEMATGSKVEPITEVDPEALKKELTI